MKGLETVKKSWAVAKRWGYLGKRSEENLWWFPMECVMSIVFPITPQRPWHCCDMPYVYSQIKHIYYYKNVNIQVTLKWLWMLPVFGFQWFWKLLLSEKGKGFEVRIRLESCTWRWWNRWTIDNFIHNKPFFVSQLEIIPQSWILVFFTYSC